MTGLPPPASSPGHHRPTFGGVSIQPHQKGFRIHWARLKERFTTSIDAPSESRGDEETVEGSTTWRRVTNASTTHASSQHTPWNAVVGGEGDGEPDFLDEIVVDHDGWNLNVESTRHGPASVTNKTGSERNANPEASTSYPFTDHDSIASSGILDRWIVWDIIRWRILPFARRFQSQAFMDPAAELQFQRESWFSKKAVAIWAGAWLIINWVIACALAPEPRPHFDMGWYYAFAPVLALPVPLLVIFDYPRKRPRLYQIFVTMSVWSWAFVNLLNMYLCGFYKRDMAHWTCGGKDFLTFPYYAVALPTIGVFALQLERVPTLIGSTVIVGMTFGLIVPLRHGFTRNCINLLVFYGFLLFIHYTREVAERRLYTLREQVKLQYRATQKAQVSERKLADSKKRLTSYIFHEVRVPLNTAMLALQNLQASLKEKDPEQNIELSALEGSLSMMSKDELFTQMSMFQHYILSLAGQFEFAHNPFSFHRAIRSTMVGLKLAADDKNLDLLTELDPNIDSAARVAMYRDQGKSEDWISWQLATNPNEEGFMTGDVMRLVQVVTNLTSNAVKFTPSVPGNRITLRTKLIHPTYPIPPPLSGSTAFSSLSMSNLGEKDMSPRASASSERNGGTESEGLSVTRLTRHDSHTSQVKPMGMLQKLVVRIEIQDTGVGIRARDMIDNRLFSPYVQTEQGRAQGGKGTGLGLALVQNIVKLSGGRLGVTSKRHEGSTFWVELPLGIVRKGAEIPTVIPVTRRAPPRFLATPRQPLQNPFVHQPISRHQDGDTPGSEMTQSSLAPSKFIDLVGAAEPREQSESIDLDYSEIDHGPRPELHVIGPSSDDSLSPKVQYGSPEPSTPQPPLSPRPNETVQLPSSPPPPTLSPAGQPSTPLESTPADLSLPRPPLASVATAPIPRPSHIRMPSNSPMLLHAVSDPVPEASAGDSSTSTVATWDPSTPLNVLVVDDDMLTRRLMERMLKRIGCTVDTAENGQIALDMILAGDPLSTGSSHYAVVFLDNQMPVLSGVETVKRLRELNRTDFLVGITGNALKEDMTSYKEAGLDRVLTKPVLERSLKEVLKIASDRRSNSPPAGVK